MRNGASLLRSWMVTGGGVGPATVLVLVVAVIVGGGCSWFGYEGPPDREAVRLAESEVHRLAAGGLGMDVAPEWVRHSEVCTSDGPPGVWFETGDLGDVDVRSTISRVERFAEETGWERSPRREGLYMVIGDRVFELLLTFWREPVSLSIHLRIVDPDC